jgi:hypothetical protein
MGPNSSALDFVSMPDPRTLDLKDMSDPSKLGLQPCHIQARPKTFSIFLIFLIFFYINPLRSGGQYTSVYTKVVCLLFLD